MPRTAARSMGTVLGTSRTNPYGVEGGPDRVMANLERLGIDAHGLSMERAAQFERARAAGEIAVQQVLDRLGQHRGISSVATAGTSRAG